MILLDVNVLVYAYLEEAPRHREYHAWLVEAAAGPRPIGLAGVVVAGFVRIVTDARIYSPPSDPERALDFVAALRRHPAVATVHPGPRHLDLFDVLVRESLVRGNDVPDAYLAAVAAEQRAEIATADSGFSRFRGTRFFNPVGS